LPHQEEDELQKQVRINVSGMDLEGFLVNMARSSTATKLLALMLKVNKI